jgi:hypothetical protein
MTVKSHQPRRRSPTSSTGRCAPPPPYVRKAAPEVIASATAQCWEHADVRRVLLSEEAAVATGQRSGSG